MPKEPKHGIPARERVLAAYKDGSDWMLVAEHNNIPPTTAQGIIERGTANVKARGGARASCTKCAPEMEEALLSYLEENCTYGLEEMKQMIRFDFGVQLSTSLISKKLCGRLYSVKQVRVQPETCNSTVNIEKRRVFAEALLAHEANGSFIVYYDETNYNLYCKRSQGRSPIGKRAVVKLPSSKGPNLQLQCAVSPEVGLVHWAKQRGSIKMSVNAAFVDDVYVAVKEHPTYQDNFAGRTIVIVLDNAPAHCQTEELVKDRDDLELLRLGPYSPMCNPIEGCFGVLKAKIKAYLARSTHEMLDLRYGEMAERRMNLLERAAEHCMPCIDLRLVSTMARHCAHSVAAAIRSEPMEYGT